MSRSFKKTPKFGQATKSVSEKKDKRLANRKLRKKLKQLRNKYNDICLPILREVSDVWGFRKDGKVYIKNIDKKYLRK